MKKTLFLFLVIFSTCMVIGFLGGTAAGEALQPRDTQQESILMTIVPAQGSSQPEPEPGKIERTGGQAEAPRVEPTPRTGQRTVLVVGVDDLKAEQPRLQSVWLAMYIPSSPGLTLAPLYPAITDSQPQANEDLRAAFALTPERTPAPAFTEAIQRYDLRWNQYVVLDAAGLATLVDFFGGVELGATRLDGAAIIRYLADHEGEVGTAIESQAALMKALCARSNQAGEQIDVYQLFTLLDGHLSTSMTAASILDDWQTLGSAGSRLCKFPTLR